MSATPTVKPTAPRGVSNGLSVEDTLHRGSRWNPLVPGGIFIDSMDSSAIAITPRAAGHGQAVVQIIAAVKAFVPQEKWPELPARLRGEPPPPSQTTSGRVPQAIVYRDGFDQAQRRGRVIAALPYCRSRKLVQLMRQPILILMRSASSRVASWQAFENRVNWGKPWVRSELCTYVRSLPASASFFA